MRRLWVPVGVLLASLGGGGCDGRELPVFEFPAQAGNAGTGGTAGAANQAGGSGSGGVTLGGGTSGDAGSGGNAGTGGDSVLDPGGGSNSVAGNGGGSNGGSSGGAGAPTGGSAGGGPTPPMPCGGDVDCSPGWVCEKNGCNAAMGLCAPLPVFCPPEPKPVCGCDGVTYWNDCIRLKAHATVASLDQCRLTACACEVGSDCKVPYATASCSHLVGDTCGHGKGACWVLPPHCPPDDSKTWRECKPPPGMPAACVDSCTAIASERSYIELNVGESCQ